MERVPFNRPYVPASAPQYAAAVLASDHHSGDGPWSQRAADLLQPLVGGGGVLLTTSCTHALEMTALLLDIEPGDEVVVPSFTFPSTANAFAIRGARLRFCDSRPDTLNLDEQLLPSLVGPRTKAIVVMHYAGIACDMDAISELSAATGVPVVEDNAHGLGGSLRGQPLGSFGAMATQSFHETKNIQCGEGGAIVVNDPGLWERAEIVREKGTNRSAFFRGHTSYYTWVDLGSSYLLAETLAALLVAQFEEYASIQAARLRVWNSYYEQLKGWTIERGFGIAAVPEECEHPAHLFYLLTRSSDERARFLAHLGSAGVNAVSHYVPLHDSPMGERVGTSDACPVASDIAGRLVRLPLYPELGEAELARVITAVRSFET